MTVANEKPAPERTRGPATSVEACRDAIAAIYINTNGKYGNEQARSVLDKQLRFGKRMRESTSGYIIGHSRCGKTETIGRFIEKTTGAPFKRRQQNDTGPELSFEEQLRLAAAQRPARHPPMFARLYQGNGNRPRILYADMTSGITPLSASRMILDGIFHDSKASRVGEGEAGNDLAWFMSKCHVDLFVLDEAQQMFRNMGPHALKKFASWILALENTGSFGIVIAGTPELDAVRLQSDASNQRIGRDARLMPFPYKEEEDRDRFADFVAEFGRMMPFESTPLDDEDLMPAFFYATRGRVGVLAKLAELAATLAFEKQKRGAPRKLTIGHFAEAFDISLLHDWRMKRTNPFRDAPLPTIPLCIEDEEDERQKILAEMKREQRKAARRKGHTLY